MSIGYKIITQEELKYQSNNPLDSSWPMYQHDAANTGYSEAQFPNSFNQTWFTSYQQDLNTSMVSMFASPVTYNGKIFITGDKTEHDDRRYGIIFALNQSDGGLIWEKKLPLNKNAFIGFHGYHSPAVYESKIFTVLGCFFSAFSKSKIVALVLSDKVILRIAPGNWSGS